MRKPMLAAEVRPSVVAICSSIWPRSSQLLALLEQRDSLWGPLPLTTRTTVRVGAAGAVASVACAFPSSVWAGLAAKLQAEAASAARKKLANTAIPTAPRRASDERIGCLCMGEPPGQDYIRCTRPASDCPKSPVSRVTAIRAFARSSWRLRATSPYDGRHGLSRLHAWQGGPLVGARGRPNRIESGPLPGLPEDDFSLTEMPCL